MRRATGIPPAGEPILRSANQDDALAIAALSIQVFLDTYATGGVRPDLAREAFAEYSGDAFAARLREPDRRFILVEQGEGLVGFAEMIVRESLAPAGSVQGAQLVRLYVQPTFQRTGLGRTLIREAEKIAAGAGLTALWLTAWDENRRARDFYAAQGYDDVGATTYTFEGRDYGNRVLARRLSVPGMAT